MEGQELNGGIPHKYNLDFTNSINLKKGCFLGQELTASTHYKGVVRKRPFAFFVEPKDSQSSEFKLEMADPSIDYSIQKGKVLKDSQGKRALKIIDVVGNVGIGFLEYLAVSDRVFEDEEYRYKVLDSTIFEEQIKEYKVELDQREEKYVNFD